MRFLVYQISLFDCMLLLHNFLTRFASEISCFFAVLRCPYEICRVLLHTFLIRFPYEISCFIMRCLCEIVCFLVHNFRMRYSSCFFGSLRALRTRLHACLAVLRCRAFWLPNVLFDGVV